MQGLGERFDQAVRDAERQLLVFPNSAPHFRGPYRRKILHGFEHGIFYQVVGQRIVIAAIVSLRQDPDAILKRRGFSE
jgi:plasmid stabilization system protein ParE